MLQYQKYYFSFGGKHGDTIASLRYGKFMQPVATCLVLEHETLPRTQRVMYFHSLRVHLHICHWNYVNLHYLTPEEWDRRFVDNVLKPTKTDMQPALESRLKFVRCKCKSATKYVYRKNLCSCQKHGLKWWVACG